MDTGKKVTILYFGDHDPSGLDMVRDIDTRMTEFLTECDDPISVIDIADNFSVHPLALTKEQITTFNPPPNPAKFSDPRAKYYIEEHGKVSWELDAIDPLTLQKIAEDGVLLYLNQEMYLDMVKQESEDAKALVAFGDTL